ncbi:methyl-accepting chemotaxis protein [Cohnella boryungensis]|uniref:Methyl-accepting chemotaxis protein n=1 Tax=Cohnella boryungensis TaxID=768479 RepID=A0ABV8S8T4_9BACL
MPSKSPNGFRSWLAYGSLRQTAGRIVLSTLLIVVVCVAVLSYTFYTPAASEVRSKSEQQMQLTAQLIASDMDANLNEKKVAMQLIAEHGSEIAANRQQQLDFIVGAQKQHPEFESIFFSLDLTGAHAVNIKGIDVDLSDRDYIRLAQEGKTFVSDPVISKTNNTMVVIIGAPLKKNGKTHGFYGASYPIGPAVESVSTARFGETGGAFMTLGDGTFLSYKDESYILAKKISDLGNPKLDEALASAKQGNLQAFTFTEDGSDKIGYMSAADSGWFITLYADESEILQSVNELLSLILTVGACIFVFSIVLNLLIVQRIVKPIRQLNEGIDLLAKGDLTYRIPVKGNSDISKALRSYNAAGEQMHLMMKDVRSLSEELTESAKHLADGAEQGAQAAQNISGAIQVVAESTERQTSSVQDGNGAAESIAAQVDGVAAHSADAALIASEASRLSDEGAASMEQLSGKMGEMEQGIGELSNTIHTLSGLSVRIGDIVTGISEIARQTNILSLNASIEASRSGESGRGFAVVAAEIRKLAMQSMESTEQITGFIENVQYEIERTRKASEKTVDQAAGGKQAGEEAKEMFARIRSSIQQVAQSITGVSAAADEIATGTNKLVESIRLIADSATETSAESENVSAAAQEQMASLEEIASSSVELANRSERLRNQISKFTL